MSFIADHRWSVFVSLEPRATKPLRTGHVAPGQGLPVQEGERRQGAAAGPRALQGAAGSARSVPPGRELSA